MYAGKVELCGVDTARLPVLSEAEKSRLIKAARAGDRQARQEMVQNFLRFAFSKSVLRATRISALGYSSKASAAICSVRWLGTTISVLLQSPSRFFSMALATISNVFPAPTSCASSTLLPYSTWAMALRWCGRRVISGFMPGKCRWLPSYSRGRRQLNLVLYIETNRWRRVGSLKIQS